MTKPCISDEDRKRQQTRYQLLNQSLYDIHGASAAPGNDNLRNYGPDDVQNMGRSMFLGNQEQKPLGLSMLMRENHFENRQGNMGAH